MKQQKQIIALVVLLVIAAAVWIWNRRQSPVSVGATTIVSTYSPMNVDNLSLRSWDREASRKTEYKGSGRNPFSAVPPPPPPPKVLQPGEKGYVAPPPPPPPRADLPLKFFGYGTVPNGTARRAYLSDGDEVYIVAEGDTILGHYRILKIGNATLDFEDTTMHVQGQKNLDEAGPNSAPNGS